MQQTAVLALLCAVMAAAALPAAAQVGGACPRGWGPVPSASAERLAKIGFEAWSKQAQKSVCDRYPRFWSAGLQSPYGVEITPACTDGEGQFLFEVSARNPCAPGGVQQGTMTVDTRERQGGGVSAASVGDTRVSPAIVYPGTVVTRDPAQLEPLQCPPGFSPATRAQLADTVVPFIEAYISTNETAPAEFRAGGALYCPSGFDELGVDPAATNGCLEEQVGGVTGVMASATIVYKCHRAPAERTAGVVLSGEFRREAAWPISFRGLGQRVGAASLAGAPAPAPAGDGAGAGLAVEPAGAPLAQPDALPAAQDPAEREPQPQPQPALPPAATDEPVAVLPVAEEAEPEQAAAAPAPAPADLPSEQEQGQEQAGEGGAEPPFAPAPSAYEPTRKGDKETKAPEEPSLPAGPEAEGAQPPAQQQEAAAPAPEAAPLPAKPLFAPTQAPAQAPATQPAEQAGGQPAPAPRPITRPGRGGGYGGAPRPGGYGGYYGARR